MAGVKTSASAAEQYTDIEGASVLQSFRKRLTSAQVLALFATPVTVVPAPGTGRLVKVEFVQFLKPAGTAYVHATDLQLRYKTEGTVVAQLDSTAVLESAGRTRRVADAFQAASNPSSQLGSAQENFAIELFATVANPTTGNTVLDVIVWARVLQSNFSF